MIVRNFGDAGEFSPNGRFKVLRHQWPDAGEPKIALIGESASAVGWIPFYKRSEQLPDGFLKNAWHDFESSIPMLLKSGNNSPNESFDGPIGFEVFADQHQFRAILSIDQPTLFLDARGRPSLLEFFAIAEAGTTPFRAEYLVSPAAWYTYYSGGDARASGDISQEPSEAPRSVTLRVFLRMRLGWIGRLVGKFVTGYWPPWAIAMVEYTFHLTEPYSYAVSFCGSSVPSQTQYINWRKVSEYRMERDMSQAGYEGFIRANGMDAPFRSHGTIQKGLMVLSVSPEPISTPNPPTDMGPQR